MSKNHLFGVLSVSGAGALIVALSLSRALSGCCADAPENPDTQLQVEITDEITDELAGEDGGEPSPGKCGMQVTAISSSGDEQEMQEVQEGDGCVYRAEVDPHEVYTIRAKDPQLGEAEGANAQSNPATCGEVSPTNTTDARFAFQSSSEDGGVGEDAG